MSYLLDTCVVCDPACAAPNQGVRRFLNNLPSAWISCLTLGEISKGVLRLAESRRKRKLENWIAHDLADRFRDRVLPVDQAVALRWATLLGDMEARGRALPVIDSLIAATALQHGLKLVTRNVADFAGTGVTLVNPWS
jgi:tRNA(fMet)-specific endonuclease VapC